MSHLQCLCLHSRVVRGRVCHYFLLFPFSSALRSAPQQPFGNNKYQRLHPFLHSPEVFLCLFLWKAGVCFVVALVCLSCPLF